MTGHEPDGILRAARRIATTMVSAVRLVAMGVILWGVANGSHTSPVFAQDTPLPPSNVGGTFTASELESFTWDFRRTSNTNLEDELEGWKRMLGIGYPEYVKVSIEPRNPALASQLQALDTKVVLAWPQMRKSLSFLPPLPPPVTDYFIDRFMRVELDGGQFAINSPAIPASHLYQYRFSCEIMTLGLRRDSALADLILLDENDVELATYATVPVTGTTPWKKISLDLIRPPKAAAKLKFRLRVDRSDDGQQDIRGTIGFDNIRIDQYPQLQLTTNEPLGVYGYGNPVVVTAKIMGLPKNASQVQFQLYDHDAKLIAGDELAVAHQAKVRRRPTAQQQHQAEFDSEVSWKLPRLAPGYYRITARLQGTRTNTLSTEATLAVIDTLVDGPAHGCFGWTLPDGNQGLDPKDLARWLDSLGVAWIKYPCWLDPADTAKADETLAVLSRFHEAGIQTVGMLDAPPERLLPQYGLRSRSDLIASQLFRDVATWQPMLEPVMTKLTLKVRAWQLGRDRDHSFLGRPRLRDSISQISTGLQGFGQPIDVAISWPWMERELSNSESSWQAICRTSDPPLGAEELDSFLELSQKDVRADGPRTWLLLDPIREDRYDRDARIRDLVLRMATTRNHRVQAAFVSNPRDPKHGLLHPNGRPNDLLLPWRTTSRMIGNLRKVGELQLQSGANNAVFVGPDRAVLMLWSITPTEEMIYLGEDVQVVDVWGRAQALPVEPDPHQPGQRIEIGRLPIFIVGADPKLLALRMSVKLANQQLDSLLGQEQQLTVQLTNPTRDSLLGTMQVLPPESWQVERPKRHWEALPTRDVNETYKVVLSNTAKIGDYPFPIQLEVETTPPKLITVYRKVQVGPDGLEVKAVTRLLPGGELRVEIELINRGPTAQSYECMLWPPAKRQYKRRFISIEPGQTTRREFYWPNGAELVGQKMLLRAIEQNGQRVLNYSIDVTR